MSTQPVQLADVAAHCGVSISTVSYILSGSASADRFSEKTRQRVLAAANELGYVRNRSARSLRRGRTNTVALFYDPPMNRFIERYQLRASEYLRDHGYLLVSIPTRANQGALIVDTLRSGLCDGAMVACPAEALNELFSALPKPPVPVLLLDAAEIPQGYDGVLAEETRTVVEALEYLESLGARHIAYAGQQPDLESAFADVRWLSYKSFQESQGRPAEFLFTTPANVAVAYQRAVAMFGELLASGKALPEAIYCASDRTAIGVVLAAQHHGISIPNDLAVVGTGNSEDAVQLEPALTSIGMSDESIETVLDHFWRRLSGAAPEPSAITERWRLAARGTTPGRS